MRFAVQATIRRSWIPSVLTNWRTTTSSNPLPPSPRRYPQVAPRSPLPFRPDVTAEISVPHAQVSAMYPPSVIGGRVMTREERFETALTCREEGKVTPKPRACAAEVSIKGDAWKDSERLAAGGVSQGVKPRQGCAAVQLNRECKENTRTPEVTPPKAPRAAPSLAKRRCSSQTTARCHGCPSRPCPCSSHRPLKLSL